MSVCSADTSFVNGNSEPLLSVDHGLDTVVHVLHQVNLGAAQPSQVRDVKDAIVALGVLAVRPTDLNVVLVGDGLKLILLLGQLG